MIHNEGLSCLTFAIPGRKAAPSRATVGYLQKNKNKNKNKLELKG
jgi:hypothetical protein